MSNQPFAFEISPMDPLVTAGCHVRMFTSSYKISWRIMPDFILYLVLGGKMDLLDYTSKSPERVVLKKGDLYIIPPGVAHESAEPINPGVKMLNVNFRFKTKYLTRNQAEATAMIRSRLSKGHQTQSQILSQSCWLIPRHIHMGDQVDSFVQLTTELLHNLRLWSKYDAGCRYIGSHLIYTLHSYFALQTLEEVAETQSKPEESHVNAATNYIRIHYDRNISVNDVADAIHLNPAYLSRCFRKMTGRTVMDFILKTKVEAAKSFLLERPIPSVKEVGFRSGFGSTAYFCRIFRRYVNRSPQEYAKGMLRTKGKQKSLREW